MGFEMGFAMGWAIGIVLGIWISRLIWPEYEESIWDKHIRRMNKPREEGE